VLPRFWVLVLVEILVYALFAASLHLLMGTGGMVSFGHAVTFGLGAYAAALLVQGAKVPMLLAFVAAPVAAALGAALIGFFAVRLTSIYFAMLTLAFCQIAYAIVHQWYDVTGGDNGVLGVWPPRWLADPARYYYVALVACAGGIALLAVAGRAPFGLTLRAIRDHARRAEASGIDVRRHQWRAFVLSGFLGGLAGATFAFLKGSVFPNSLTVATSVQPLVMVLLGGVGALAGAPIGAALYTLLDTLVTKYTEYWQLVVGAILIVLVVAFPRGLVGLLAEHAGRPAGELAYGDLKKLELAIALAGEPALLLLDEPTAGMAAAERVSLMALTVSLARERRLTVLFTEHDMDVVFAAADRIVVLHEGRVIADGLPAAVRENRQVQAVYLGEDG
jgi:branched-chain amino acid transport system permease protein